MTSFTGLDLGVLVLYLLGVTAWGAWLGRGQKGGTDYFLGNRELPWAAVMLSVVATEIRRLADQTAVATWDIEQMVREMQSAVSAGVMGMDKFSEEVTRSVEEVHRVGAGLSETIEQVQALTPRFEEVTTGMQSQAVAAQHISEGMIQLNDTAQQSAASLRESSQSVTELNTAAQELQRAVSRFKVV